MIGIYGGSFDPVHRGHVGVCRYILDMQVLDEIVLVPAWQHPLDKSLTRFDHRFRMLQLATETEPAIRVSDIERERGGISYTIQLLQILEQAHGKDGFCFITGMDNLNSLFDWKDWPAILCNYNILFTTREGVDPDPHALARMASKLDRSIVRVNRLGEPPRGVMIMPVPDWPMSSSEIRKIVLNKGNPSDMMNPKVLAYIYDHQLYTDGE